MQSLQQQFDMDVVSNEITRLSAALGSQSAALQQEGVSVTRIIKLTAPLQLQLVELQKQRTYLLESASQGM